MKSSSQLAGVTGEYFVAAELSRRDLIASITMRNSPGIDILATNLKAKRTVTIQCKTSRDKNKRPNTGLAPLNFMNIYHNFSLLNFQDHSAYVEYWHGCPQCGCWKCPCGLVDWEKPDVKENIWLKLYLTDLAVDNQVTGKAYCCWGQEEWAKDLQPGWEPWPTMRAPSPPTWKHHPEPPEVNFSLDGTSWFTVLRDKDSTEVTKRTGMNGRPRIEVPDDSPEYTEIIKAYERLNELVSAVTAKPPDKS